MEKETTKEIYNKKICEFCRNNDNCPKNKFTKKDINGRVSIICYSYDFDESKVIRTPARI